MLLPRPVDDAPRGAERAGRDGGRVALFDVAEPEDHAVDHDADQAAAEVLIEAPDDEAALDFFADAAGEHHHDREDRRVARRLQHALERIDRDVVQSGLEREDDRQHDARPAANAAGISTTPRRISRPGRRGPSTNSATGSPMRSQEQRRPGRSTSTMSISAIATMNDGDQPPSAARDDMPEPSQCRKTRSCVGNPEQRKTSMNAPSRSTGSVRRGSAIAADRQTVGGSADGSSTIGSRSGAGIEHRMHSSVRSQIEPGAEVGSRSSTYPERRTLTVSGAESRTDTGVPGRQRHLLAARRRARRRSRPRRRSRHPSPRRRRRRECRR